MNVQQFPSISILLLIKLELTTGSLIHFLNRISSRKGRVNIVAVLRSLETPHDTFVSFVSSTSSHKQA